MKKLKKLTALVLILALFSSFAASAEGNDVEISFKVGESTLSVNGKALTVETPYVAGEGVTLVPLRVITEAFGAEVGWDGETKTVTLKYPGVDILITVGSKVAEVNKKAETLLEAPVLTESGVTMVPLRFISETFGAEVSYDDETAAITVKLSDSAGKGNTVAGAVTEDFIGDSYYGWTIENPKDMTMTDRSFDGTYTEFSDGNNWICIAVDAIGEDFSFEEYFSDVKGTYSDMALVKADKGESDNVRTMHFQGRNKSSFINERLFFTDKYIYTVLGRFENDNEAIKDEGIRIAETFKLNFDKDKAYDLSNAEDGMRTFKAEAISAELKVPADYYLYSDEEYIDLYSFVKNNGDSAISLSVFSKSEVRGAKELADSDRKINSEITNEAIATTSGVSECKYPGFSGFYYTQVIKGSVGNDGIIKDVFFDNGDYVYNISLLMFAKDGDDAEELSEKVLSSLTVKKPDTSKLGTILRNEPNREEIKTVKGSGFSIQLPMSFEKVELAENLETYADAATGIAIAYSSQYADVTTKRKDVTEIINAMEERAIKSKYEIVKSTSDVVLNTRLYTYCVYKVVSEDEATYIATYAKLNQNSIDFITVAYPEIVYSKANIEMVETALGTLEIK